ncbi:alpha/beta fold hydrolase [Arcicella rosea]|uniref:Pimeloyl-ACP methyl ester carboxylesterase n=1 Tax=Arcicella rosea TaxID=502909 RepID=A0A841EN70_9BACT|nr:alpha/beta hydrolase [Arcicella rosea]MBB6002178.1 pimeloyl-ACP methyl ester carboxylesterase [Arcicella rosea]
MKLYFQKIGNGQKILLAFHGIGQDFLCFQHFAETFGDVYTIYAFDLPFHGKSIVENANQLLTNQVLTKSIWKDFLITFLTENQIKTFSVIGFSMGGRFALATVEAFPKQIESMTLVSPDGISEHLIYSFATRFRLTRKVFKYVLFQEEKLLSFTKFFAKMHIVPESSIRFAHRMLDTQTKKKQVFQSWTGFRFLKFNIRKLAQLINDEKIKVNIFTGKYDTILPSEKVLPLATKLPNAHLITLEAGHTKILEKVIEYLKKTNKIL